MSDRNGWKDACRLATEKKAEAILVTQSDRIAQDMGVLLNALSDLAEKGIWIRAAAEYDLLKVNPLSYLLLPPDIQWQMALNNIWQNYRRNAGNSD